MAVFLSGSRTFYGSPLLMTELPNMAGEGGGKNYHLLREEKSKEDANVRTKKVKYPPLLKALKL